VEQTIEKQEEKEGKFDALEVMARLTDTDITTKEICEKWLLITYDIPKSEEGDKARREFLLEAALMGATKHTDSVYLMPWTPDAESIALALAKVGDVCVWTSETTDNLRASEITKSYDAGLKKQMKEITDRIDKMEGYVVAEQFGRALRMNEKTAKMVTHMEDAVLRRGSAILLVQFQLVQARYQQVARAI